MADTFKKLSANDSSNVRSLVHETIPVDGAIAWSAYGTYPASNDNVKSMAHGMFQSVFDYDYTNSSANHIFDITLGVHADSAAFNDTVITAPYAATYDSQYDANGYKRQQIYNALAQRLCGFDTDGEILKFDRDGDLAGGGEKYNEVIAILFTRLLHKDGIKPGSFSFDLALHPFGFGGTGADTHYPDDTWLWDGATATDSVLTISDVGADTSYRTNSPAGRFAVLYATQPAASDILEPSILDVDDKVSVGLVFYDAGIVILTPWIFLGYDGAETAATDGFLNNANDSTTMMLYNTDGGGTYAAIPTDPGNTKYTEDNSGVVGIDDAAWSGTFANDYFHVAVKMTDVDASPDKFQYSINGGAFGNETAITAGVAQAIGATGLSITFAAGDGHTLDDVWDIALTSSAYLTATELVRGYEEDPALAGGDVDLTITDFCNALRQRIDAIEFQNTTELNSTIYFCRANHNEFNYSSNPSYCDGSRIVNKDTSQDAPVSYITTIGLYSSDGALLAVAKLSEPFKKSSDTDLSLRVRIDY